MSLAGVHQERLDEVAESSTAARARHSASQTPAEKLAALIAGHEEADAER
jgi:hypothetical protein